jgi:hypothetical protein
MVKAGTGRLERRALRTTFLECDDFLARAQQTPDDGALRVLLGQQLSVLRCAAGRRGAKTRVQNRKDEASFLEAVRQSIEDLGRTRGIEDSLEVKAETDRVLTAALQELRSGDCSDGSTLLATAGDKMRRGLGLRRPLVALGGDDDEEEVRPLHGQCPPPAPVLVLRAKLVLA